jgi:hypothetical protein
LQTFGVEHVPERCPADAGGGAAGKIFPPVSPDNDLRCLNRRATMKKLLALALVVMVAGGALAQDTESNMMGMFFAEPYVSENTNLNTAAAPFNAFVVLLNASVELVGGYEVGIAISDPTVFVLSVVGPNGWTNFGSNTNHLAGYATPLPAEADGTVLSVMNMLYTGGQEVQISFGEATPPSIPGAPVIADGSNPDILISCNLTSDGGYVATLNGDGVVATEAHTLTGVKALFN